jgi:hypothetical protein
MRTLFMSLILVGFATGCYPFRDGYTYYPQGAMPQPAGTLTQQWQLAQSDKVDGQGLVFNEAAWVDGSDQLGPAAIRKLQRGCSDEHAMVHSITLEPSADTGLNDRRIQAITDLAAGFGLSISPDSIRLAYMDGNVLYGEEANRISKEMMQGNRPESTFLGDGEGGLFGGDPLGGSSFPRGIGGGF